MQHSKTMTPVLNDSDCNQAFIFWKPALVVSLSELSAINQP